MRSRRKVKQYCEGCGFEREPREFHPLARCMILQHARKPDRAASILAELLEVGMYAGRDGQNLAEAFDQVSDDNKAARIIRQVEPDETKAAQVIRAVLAYGLQAGARGVDVTTALADVHAVQIS